MKILVVHNRYQQRGGEDEVFEAETGLLEARGHQVIRYERSNEEITRYSVAQKVRLAVTTSWAQDSHESLRKLIARERPDVAHFHNTFPLISPAAYYACNEANVAVVQSVHNYRFLCPAATLFRDGRVCEECVGRAPWPGVVHGCYHDSPAQTLVVAGSLVAHRAAGTYRRRVQRYLALTEFGRSLLIRGGFPAERIRVKPNFIAPDPGKRAGGGTYALFVGRLSREKGILLLLEAWRHIHGLTLRIVGDGPLRTEVDALAKALPNVEVVGAVPHREIYGHLRKARLLLFPSEWHEGMGLVMVEAFAVGVPVIASDLGAPRELLDQGRCGTLFRSGDAQHLTDTITLCLRDHTIETKVDAARSEYERKFTDEANYPLLMQAYTEAREQLRTDQ